MIRVYDTNALWRHDEILRIRHLEAEIADMQKEIDRQKQKAAISKNSGLGRCKGSAVGWKRRSVCSNASSLWAEGWREALQGRRYGRVGTSLLTISGSRDEK